MGLEAAVCNLNAELYSLQEALVALRTTSREDKPLEDDAVLVDVYADAADDLLGWLEGARQAADEAQQLLTGPGNPSGLWRALTTCQERCQRISQRFNGDLACYDRIADLTYFGSQRGGEWGAWAASVRAALDDCQQPLFDVGQALFVCWQELGERLGVNSVAVQTISIGQQLVTPMSRENA
jgi:hypothetical protein